MTAYQTGSSRDLFIFSPPLYFPLTHLQKYIHHAQKHYNRTADVAYSTSDLIAATVHYTESTYVSYLIVLAVHTPRVKPYILHVSGCFTLRQVYSTVLHTILTQLRGNIFNNHESQKMLN